MRTEIVTLSCLGDNIKKEVTLTGWLYNSRASGKIQFLIIRDGDSFLLYSKGPNGIDEGGSSSRPADDWPSWPLKIKIIPAGEQ